MNINLKEYTINTAQIVISDKFGNKITCYYSYNTLIAIRDINNIYYISENTYSKTTGKHLNIINPDKSIRLKRDIFESIANKILSQITLKKLTKVV